MIKDVELTSKHSQVRILGSELNYNILRELINGAATCQQLANVFGVSKQKMHYVLNKLLSEQLIEVSGEHNFNAKEVYYQATAKNFVLDFSVGQNITDNTINNRLIIDRILEQEYKINLQNIAANLIDNSLKLRPKEKLLINTGKYNMPLVEKIIPEAARRGIETTLIYQNSEFLKAKYEEFSLAAFDADYKHFNQLLKTHQVYLNLNGEARYQALTDPKKIALRNKHFGKSRQIFQEKGIRLAIMPGLLHDTLSNHTIESELQFWKALDIDYDKLCQQTDALCREYAQGKTLRINNGLTNISFKISKVMAECGSFGCSRYQIQTINLPGGEVLIIPAPGSLNGVIGEELAYVLGERVIRPRIKIRDNAIVDFSAEQNESLLYEVIEQGGEDGQKVALICMGTNENIHLGNIDSSFRQKSKGLLSVYWGENVTLGGNVAGRSEWFIQIDDPEITTKQGAKNE
jgi:leucyl aminopeptidase (aminopeptidase T)